MVSRKFSRLSRVSAFAHSDDHLRQKTVHGGIVTLLGALLAATLFVSEVRRCLSVRVEQSMAVDTSRDDKLRLTFDISFPALPCQALRMDAGDVSGKFETESMAKMAHDGEVHKWRLDAFGNKLGVAEYTAPAGADNPFVLTLDQTDMDAVRDAVRQHEGCQVVGWLDLRRVAGNVHFAVRMEAMIAVGDAPEVVAALAARHVAIQGDASHPDHAKLNASHVINTLRFGRPFPGQVQPLEGVARIDRKATGIDKYFIKVVPTEHRTMWGSVLRTQQYSVTEYYERLLPGSRQLPGIFLLYDMWPIAVHLRTTRLGVLHLLARLCAVCGGVWAVTKAVDSSVHAAVRAAQKLVPKSAAP